MGNRANIFLVDTADTDIEPVLGIYLYTQHKGQDWPERLRQALITGPARLRWEDPQYLARILIDQLFSDLRDEEAGGVSTKLGDNDHPITIVDLTAARVHWAKAGDEQHRDRWTGSLGFAEFVTRGRAEYPTL